MQLNVHRYVAGVREEPQLREQDFGNFQDLKRKQLEKRERQYFGRFFYRFPDGRDRRIPPPFTHALFCTGQTTVQLI
jgi:broad specificity phosphatase PhoE